MTKRRRKPPPRPRTTLRFPASGRLGEQVALYARSLLMAALEDYCGERGATARFLGVSTRYVADAIAADAGLAALWPVRKAGRPLVGKP